MTTPARPPQAGTTSATGNAEVSVMEANRRLIEENRHLQEGMQTRARIDQAMGVVVALGGITPDEAWDLLREVSMNTNTKLRTLAEALVGWAAGGALPDDVRRALGAALGAREPT